jgi:hypothetical protein
MQILAYHVSKFSNIAQEMDKIYVGRIYSYTIYIIYILYIYIILINI